MLRPAITQLISKNDSYYSLVIGVAKRARDIASQLVEEKKTLEEKPVKTAVEEFANGKYKIVENKKTEKVDNTPVPANDELTESVENTTDSVEF